MALTKRERNIAITLGVVVLGVIANSFAIRPYFDERSDLSEKISAMSDKNAKADSLLANRAAVAVKWKDILAGGLRTNASQANILVVEELNAWANPARVSVPSVKEDETNQVGDFQQMRITATVNGSMGGIARWLYSVETSTLPIQLGDVRINSLKEGTDDLSMQVTMTTLAFVPLPPKTTPGASTPAQGATK